MSKPPNHSPRRTDDSPTAPTPPNRRRVLRAGATAAVIAATGCLAGGPLGGANADDTSADGNESDDAEGADEPGPLDAVDAYLEAAAAGDLDALDDLSHSLHPFNPAAWEEEGWEFRGGDGEEVGEYDAEVVVEDGTIGDVLELEGTEFWFAEVDLEAEIGDEDGDVVAEIDWEFEQEDRGDENGLVDDVERAQVVLTADPGIEADAVRIESTIEGSEFEVSGEEPNAWSNSWANVALHPEGDQIVVTAVQDGEETIVHREHYEP